MMFRRNQSNLVVQELVDTASICERGGVREQEPTEPMALSLRRMRVIVARDRKKNVSTRIQLRGSTFERSDAVRLNKMIRGRSSKVTVVDLSWADFGDEKTADLLCQALRNAQSMKELILYGNELGNGYNYLSNVLQTNKSLVKLRLGSNSFTKDVASSLAKGLSENKMLEELDLWNCNLGDDAGTEILKGAKYANGLKALRLSLNKLGPHSLNATCELVAKATALTTLNLDSNPNLFGKSKAANERFAQVLAENRNLLSLSLPNTGIDNHTASVIFQAMTRNDHLKYLDICFNEAVTEDGYTAMVEYIPKIKSLEHLRTQACSKFIKTAPFVHAIERNTSLLQFTYICDGCDETVSSCLQRNRVLSRAQRLLRDEEETTTPLSLFPKAISRLAKHENGGASAIFELLHHQAIFQSVESKRGV